MKRIKEYMTILEYLRHYIILHLTYGILIGLNLIKTYVLLQTIPVLLKYID